MILIILIIIIRFLTIIVRRFVIITANLRFTITIRIPRICQDALQSTEV